MNPIITETISQVTLQYEQAQEQSSYKGAKQFIQLFEPYRQKYARQIVERGLYGQDPKWVIIKHYLTEQLIEQALTGELTLAYFKRTWVNSYGIDIDAHDLWGFPLLSSGFKIRMNEVIERIGCPPSALVESPHGIHFYWFFTMYMSWVSMHEAVKRILDGLDVEILPTPYKALRIPLEDCFLDVETFEPIDPPTPDSIIRYDQSILSSKSATFDTKKSPRNRQYYVESKEREHYPLENGNTNKAVVECGITYRLAGLPIKEAVQRFHDLVKRSSGYTGDLRDDKNIERRFRSVYNRQITYIPQPKVAQLSLLAEELIEKLIERAPFSPQRRAPIRSFFTKLLVWADYIQNLSQRDPVWYTYMCEQYPYFRKNVKDGYVPLPCLLMRSWNHRYYEIIGFARQIGFLEPLETASSLKGTYSASLHTCKYYRVNKSTVIE
jgi:hypothetical protein